jgi:hypothetical protein
MLLPMPLPCLLDNACGDSGDAVDARTLARRHEVQSVLDAATAGATAAADAADACGPNGSVFFSWSDEATLHVSKSRA